MATPDLEILMNPHFINVDAAVFYSVTAVCALLMLVL